MIRGALAAALISTAAVAEPPRLGQPVQCTLGRDCFIQNYVDRDPGPGRADFMCGPLSYDGHKGTDFRPADPRRPLGVIAAAPGTVKARRDGMADVSVRAIGRDAVTGSECGNGVLVEHGDGWETQYCHLARHSLRVRAGEIVARGQALGQIGLSGRTEFHHLHFELRKDGRIVDPFVGADAPAGCGGASAPLWQQPIAYVARAVLAAGFATEAPSLGGLEAGRHRVTTLAPDAAQMVFWTQVMGLRAGDRERLRLTAPDGAVLAEVDRVASSSDQAQWLAYAGRRRREPWVPGVYRGEYRLSRDGRALLRADATVRVDPQ